MEISMEVELKSISASESREFLQMAERYFLELNGDFVPTDDWKTQYFERISATGETFLRWVVVAGERVGFILFGFEEHRFLNRRIGMIYELFVLRSHRGHGAGRSAAEQAIRFLEGGRPSKIQLEIVAGNEIAKELWKSLGFLKAAERYVLVTKRKTE